MKIILLQDIKKVGKKHEVKNVADGYARNLLIPQGKAMAATQQNIKTIQSMEVMKVKQTTAQIAKVKEVVQKMGSDAIVLTAKANEKGSLFAGIDANTLHEALKSQHKLFVAPEHLLLEAPIKEVGAHEVAIVVAEERVPMKIVVEKE